MAQRIKPFLLQYGPLLTTDHNIFSGLLHVGSRMYPAMQNPQAFFNLFINNGSLLLVSIGMTLVILTGGIDLSVGGMIALTSTASAALLRNGVSPALVIPLMLVMGVAFGFILGMHHPFFQSAGLYRNADGPLFARGMAYIISLTSVTITDDFYKTLALTQVPIPFVS
jgi:galactofuranose transport system permease protein